MCMTDQNLKTCTFLKIQLVYKLLDIRGKYNSIFYFYFSTSNQKSACLEVSNCVSSIN